MLYDEKIMRELCEEYGIKWVEGRGYPSLNGVELINYSVQKLFPASCFSISKKYDNLSYLVDPEIPFAA